MKHRYVRMIRVIRRMNMYVYRPWALVYIHVRDNEFPSTGTDETCSPGICMGATTCTGFWFKKTFRGLRIGPPPIYHATHIPGMVHTCSHVPTADRSRPYESGVIWRPCPHYWWWCTVLITKRRSEQSTRGCNSRNEARLSLGTGSVYSSEASF